MRPLKYYNSLCRLLWIKENDKEIYNRIDKIFLISDFLAYKLTGKRIIDNMVACTTQMFDAKCNDWSELILKTFKIDKNKLSKVVRTGEEIGYLKDDIRKELGINGNPILIAGCHDQIAATIGAKIFNTGDILLSEGASEGINGVVPNNIDLKSFCEHYPLEPLLDTGKYVFTAGHPCNGNCINWFNRNILLYDNTIPKYIYGSELFFIPYFNRENMVIGAKCTNGIFFWIEYVYK